MTRRQTLFKKNKSFRIWEKRLYITYVENPQMKLRICQKTVSRYDKPFNYI